MHVCVCVCVCVLKVPSLGASAKERQQDNPDIELSDQNLGSCR